MAPRADESVRAAKAALLRAQSAPGGAAALPYAELPRALCAGQRVDLRCWTLLFTDGTARAIAEEAADAVQRHVDEHFDEAAVLQAALRSGSAPKKKKTHISSKKLLSRSASARSADGPLFHPVVVNDSSSSSSSLLLFDAHKTTMQLLASQEDGDDDDLLSLGNTRDDWRRVARKEAEAAQVRKVVEDARAAAYRRAVEATGVRQLFVGGAIRLTDAGLSAMARACPMLTDLDCSSAVRVSDVGVRSVAQHCELLRKLDLGGCASLKGAGLAAVGARCKALETLRVAGCSAAVCGWAFAALVEGCGLTLKHLDVSHCALLTDADCGAIAKRCPNLTSLNLASTRQTGDEACVVIAAQCSQIERLDLSRTELPHRTTDVALLALADGCGRVLRDLNLRGCEAVTDVGVSWLAHQAGATLERLNLRGCDKVTNAGCRALADHCCVLQKLDLHGARRVTDVGLRVLGATLGDRLEFLDCSAMHLLTDGQDRGFGFEGLLALARDAKTLKQFHLDGCFQVSTRSLKALGGHGLTTLTELGLAGCPRLTAEGIRAVCEANAATLLKLSLACCGDCVDDHLIIACSKSAPRVRHAVLRDCDKFGRAGMRSIGHHWHELERLDLTHCSGVDDEGVADLADVAFKRPFRHLLLGHCRGVGDLGLTWLTEGPGGRDLVTLALVKTRCTTAVLTSVRDKFPLSDLKRDEAFFGFYPKQRWEHRQVIQDHASFHARVVKVQTAYRVMSARLRVVAMRTESAFLACVVLLQGRFRARLAGRRVARVREVFDRRIRAAVVLQNRIARPKVARLHFAARRAEYDFVIHSLASTTIAATWRGVTTRREVRDLLLAAKRLKVRRTKAARTIERVGRGRFARREAGDRRRLLRLEHQRRVRAATAIARRYRVMEAKKVYAELFRVIELKKVERDAAARVLQRCLMNLRLQRLVASNVARRVKRQAAIIDIQRIARGRRAHVNALMRLAERERRAEDRAARRIQAAEKQRFARAVLRARQQHRRDHDERRRVGALRMQRAARGLLGRHRADFMRRDKVEAVFRLVRLRVASAMTIEALARGRRGRLKAAERRETHKRRWKEMFDEDSQRAFFYDQVTGEVRWRRPQDLLDLMKKPICGNCAYFEATLECATCAEFFCDECHGQVHYGGKRAGHPFRALYDAFGKRVDYGDGTFDSMWPSEIQQDETQGILLRISPLREPVETIGTWQRYEDPQTQASFYYNPISGEGTYEPPLAVFNQQQIVLLQAASGTTATEYDNYHHQGKNNNNNNNNNNTVSNYYNRLDESSWVDSPTGPYGSPGHHHLGDASYEDANDDQLEYHTQYDESQVAYDNQYDETAGGDYRQLGDYADYNQSAASYDQTEGYDHPSYDDTDAYAVTDYAATNDVAG